LASNIRKHGVDGFVNFLATMQIWGTPEQVFLKLVEYQRRADAAALIAAFSYGGMPHDFARRNMTLFAERVLPQLKALDVGTDIGRPASLPVDWL
jgi:hypothetical protein